MLNLQATMSAPCNFEFCLDKIFRVWSYHDLELAGLNHKAHLAIPESQLFSRQHKLNASLLTGLKRNALKAFQFFHGAGHACSHVTNVKLNHFIARALAYILDINTDR